MTDDNVDYPELKEAGPMKRTVVLPGRFAGAGLVPLMRPLLSCRLLRRRHAGDVTGETVGPHR